MNEYAIFVFEFISAVLAFYFLCIEMVTVKGVNWNEFKESYMELGLNFLSPILILATQFLSFFIPEGAIENSEDGYWELLAWTSFFLWFRFLLMLRSVRNLSPAVSMVIRSLKEIIPYLGVVAIGVFAFSDAF